MKNEEIYIEKLKKSAYDRISEVINEKTIDYIVNVDLVKSHVEDKNASSFHKYYLKTLKDEKYYFKVNNFFREFKREYSLQGIDNDFLDKLEGCKDNILNDIRDDRLADLYFKNFKRAEIRHGSKTINKELGSFFSKLVHTFRPNEYCALDNPIKKYFGLKNESFFVSFLIISAEYKHWANDNNSIVQEIKNRFKQADSKNIIEHERLTDLKLLDLIFWSKANRN